MSSELPVLSEVPQGSLIGPLFFLVYISDIYIIMSTNFGYLDDFKIIEENPVTLNIDARRVYKWCSDNFLSMNVARSKNVAIKGCATVSLTKCTFEKAETTKHLGVFFSENLSWSPQAKKRVGPAIKTVYNLEQNISKATLVN